MAKIRCGFVSNSSSSSFIIQTYNKNVLDLLNCIDSCCGNESKFEKITKDNYDEFVEEWYYEDDEEPFELINDLYCLTVDHNDETLCKLFNMYEKRGDIKIIEDRS